MPNSRLNSHDEIGETPGVVVEDGDVAAGHVGDVDLVALLDQADQRAAHADDVVVGVRAEDQHGPALSVLPDSAGRVRADRGHHLVEDAPAQALRRAVLAQQLVQLVFAEVVVGELEQALADLEAQPDDGPADQRRRPVHRPTTHGRRTGVSCAGGGLVEQEGRVGVLLQEAGGRRRRSCPLRRPAARWGPCARRRP